MERKNLSDKHKLKYSDTKPILKEILKGLLYIEKKQTDIGRRKSQLKSQCTYRLKKKKLICESNDKHTEQQKDKHEDIKNIKS